MANNVVELFGDLKALNAAPSYIVNTLMILLKAFMISSIADYVQADLVARCSK